jgi:protein phosphatase
VLAVLLAGGIGTYVWALGHWFVGVQNAEGTEEVAVFRGLNASFAGLDFYRLDDPTGLMLTDLTPAAQSRVRGGITADDAADADRILDALRDQRLPLCPSDAPADDAGAPSTPPVPDPSGVGITPPVTEPVPPATPTSPSSTSPGTTTSPEPRTDCREDD